MRPECDDQRDQRAQAALEATRRADAEERAHQEPEIEAPDVDEEAFQDVRVAPQVRPAHPAGLIEMGVRPLQAFAAASLQPTAAGPAYPPAVRIDRVARRRLAAPVTRPAIWFRDVCPQVECRQIHQHLIAVVALVGDDLVDHRGVAPGGHGDGLEVLRSGGHCLRDRRGVALVGPLHRNPDDRARLQIDGVLGLVREVRAAVLHLRDTRVGVVRMPPLRVAAFLRPLAIKPRQVGPGRCLDARDLRQPRQKVLIRLARIAPHDAAQRGVGFERRRIDPDRLALDEIGGRQYLQDPGEDGAVGLEIDEAPRPRDRRMLRRRLLEAQAQEAAQRQRVGRPPRDPTLGIDPFEVPD